MSNWFDKVQNMSTREVLEYLNGYYRNETNDIVGEIHKLQIANVAADTPITATVWAAPGAGKRICVTEIHMVKGAKLNSVLKCFATYKDSAGAQYCFTSVTAYKATTRLTGLHIELPENSALTITQVTTNTAASVKYEVLGYVRNV